MRAVIDDLVASAYAIGELRLAPAYLSDEQAADALACCATRSARTSSTAWPPAATESFPRPGDTGAGCRLLDRGRLTSSCMVAVRRRFPER